VIEIEEIKYKLTQKTTAEFEYDKQPNAREFDLVKQNESTYNVVKNTDYTIKYVGENYDSTLEPTDAGIYKVVITFANSNFVFVEDDNFSFKILKKQVKSVDFTTVLDYNAKEQDFEFSFDDVIESDKTNLKVEFAVRDKDGKDVLAINAGEYTLEITAVGNENYFVNNLVVPFVINKANITINLFDQTSVYGETVIVSQTDFEVKSGEIFENDENVKDTLFTLSTTATSESDVATYAILVSNKNTNYNITIDQANYVVTKREVVVDFGTLSYTYSASNLYSSIKTTITTPVTKDINNIKFELFNSKNDKTTIFEDAGQYKYKLVENSTTNNYVFKDKFGVEKTEETFTINQKKISVSLLEKVVKNYNKEVKKTDFKINHDDLAGSHKIEDIATFEFEVWFDKDVLDYTKPLDVATYVVKIIATQTELGENYIIETKNGELQIIEGATHFETEFTSKFYDEQKVDFTATLFDADNNQITDAQIDYYITKDNKEANEIREVVTYQITVSATVNSNYSVSSKTFTYIVKENVVTITLNNANPTYNGKGYVPSYSVTMSETVSIKDKLTYKIVDAEGNDSDAINVADYVVKFNLADENYNLKVKEFNVSIKPIDVYVKILDREIYYGDDFDIQTTQTEQVEGVLEDESLDLRFEIVNFSSVVNDYVLSAKNYNSNYNASITPATFKVKQRELSISYSGKTELIFNELGYAELLTAEVENSLSNEAYSIYYQNENKQQITKISDAGTYYLVVEIADTHNFKFKDLDKTSVSTTINISAKTLSLNININSKIYDGQMVEFKGVECGEEIVSTDLYNVEYLKGEESVSEPKNVGNYTIKIT
ncbi:MAG: hypothetical protein IKY10_01275, partial [Clostridia bacterium]|nr:hypothetical protein [Clostridia bacterium]